MKQIFDDLNIFRTAIKINYKISQSLIWYISFNAFLNAIFPLLNAYFSSEIINKLLNNYMLKDIISYAVLVVTVQLIIRILLRILAKKIQIKKSIWNNMCVNYINNISSTMDYEHFENPSVNEIYTRVCNANENKEGLYAINEHLGKFISSITRIISCSALFLYIIFAQATVDTATEIRLVNSSYVAGLFFVFMIIKVLFQGLIDSKMTKKVYAAWGDASRPSIFYNRMYSLGTEYSNGMNLRVFNESDIIIKKTRDFVKDPNGITKIAKLWIRNSIYHQIVDLFFVSFQYLFIVGKVLSGAFGIGNLVLYSQTLNGFSNGILGLTNLLVDIKSNNRFIRDFLNYINLPNKMRSGTKSIPNLDHSKYVIEFHNVSFQYPHSENYVLKNINLTLSLNKTINIVGLNGSGKTTFVKLLCRLYDPTEGEILLNGINIKEYEYDKYMSFFAVVFQDYKLFSFTLGQNVGLTNNYDVELARKSLIEAGFGERLAKLDKGLDTYLYKTFESTGVEISGGEAQKIAIARSLYKNSKTIIMDEPTAALDPVAEFEIYSGIQRIIDNRSVFCISHRLSSCKICDRILVFERGRIVQDGNHHALVCSDGPYKRMWEAQAKYYISENEGNQNDS